MAPSERSPLLSGGPLSGKLSSRRRKFLAVGLAIVVAGVVAIAFLLLNHGASSSSNSRKTHTMVSKHSIPQENDSISDDAFLTMMPPYVQRLHPLPPRLINPNLLKKAVPTNEFWTNMMIGDEHGLNVGAGPVTLSPYTVKSLPERLEVSYGDTRRIVTSENITEYYNADVAFTGYSVKEQGASSPFGSHGVTSREVIDYDPLSVTVQFYFDHETSSNASKHSMTALLVRGSPYVTVEYHNILPVIEFNSTILRINQQDIQIPKPAADSDSESESESDSNVQTFTSHEFEIDVLTYGADQLLKPQKWVLYFAEKRTLALQYVNQSLIAPYSFTGVLSTPTAYRLVDTDFYTGPSRLAVVPAEAAASVSSEQIMALLSAHASKYPVGATVETQVELEKSKSSVKFCWLSRDFNEENSESQLLMLADPHHVATFGTPTTTEFQVLKRMGHRTLKSFMTPVLGDCRVLEEQLPEIGFHAPRPIAPEYLPAIQTALKNDSNFTPSAEDPYFFGKEICRQARLVLVADLLKENDLREQLLNDLEEWILPWLLSENMDHFVYDLKWGGLCSKNGLKGIFWMSDFGNGWYNDHHFHYGYLIYSLAILARFRPEIVHTHRAAVFSIVRDIANPNEDDSYFPLTRHFSWFDGHSFASGVYMLDGGKSQESISEAINAYYSVYLLGKELQVPQIEKIGRLLTAMEMRAAETYWQMGSKSSIYEELYAQNKMTGQIASTKASYTTWFGPQPEHMHLINMIPFTPIAEFFLSEAYIQEEYPVLQQQAFDRKVDPIDERWKGYAYLALAIIRPEEAWTKVQEMDFFDDGSSRTTSLYWIATRPRANSSALIATSGSKPSSPSAVSSSLRTREA